MALNIMLSELKSLIKIVSSIANRNSILYKCVEICLKLCNSLFEILDIRQKTMLAKCLRWSHTLGKSGGSLVPLRVRSHTAILIVKEMSLKYVHSIIVGLFTLRSM